MLAPRRPSLSTDGVGYPAARLLGLIESLRTIGVDVELVLALAGDDLPALAADDEVLSFDRLRWLVRALQHSTTRPALALETGLRVPLTSWGTSGGALECAPNLREVLGLLRRLGTQSSGLIAATSVSATDGVWWVFEPCQDLGELQAFLLDHEAACFAALVYAVAGRWPHDAVLEVPWQAPCWRGAYEQLAGTLRFGAGRMAWWLPDALLDRANPQGSTAAFRDACQRCEAEAEQRRLGLLLKSRIARLLRSGEPGMHLSGAMAARFGITTRTLIRRLASEGTTFQALVDEWRREEALQLLRHRDLPVDEIARRLGYRNGSNFSRCARRWFGRSPRRLLAAES